MFKRRLSFFSMLFLAVGITVGFTNPPGPAEEVASKCKDLGGKFAKIGVLPVFQDGAPVLLYHEKGYVLRQVPEEGIPFSRMTAKEKCYRNGRIPPRDEKGKEVWVGVVPATGEVGGIANCGNEVTTDFRFSPEEQPPPCTPVPCDEPPLNLQIVDNRSWTLIIQEVMPTKDRGKPWCCRDKKNAAACAFFGLLGAGTVAWIATRGDEDLELPPVVSIDIKDIISPD